MYKFCFIFFTFFIFSIFGWICECIYCSIIDKKIVYNRGFLIGPYLPIYGIGALYFYVLCKFESNPLVLFLMAIFGTSILEYLTSYIMEKIFKARWWDYSNRFLNLNGRICLRNALLFGIGGVIFSYYIKPFYKSLVVEIPENTLIIVSIIFMVIYLIDSIISLNIMHRLKKNFTNMKKDSTEEIEKEVSKIISKNIFYTKKLFKSFPNVSFKLPSSGYIKKSIQEIIHKEIKK